MRNRTLPSRKASSPKKSEPKLLVALSDPHHGSDNGLMPPEVKLHSGNVVSHGDNFFQQWAWAGWLDLNERRRAICGSDPFALLLNGDLTEGCHHGSVEVIAATLAEHAEIALDVLRPLAEEASKTYVTLGTNCHVQRIEHYIAKELGAERGRAEGKWLFRINGCLVDACHHMPTSARAHLEAGAMSILRGNAVLNAQRCGHEVPQVYLRGHRHTTGVYSDGAAMVGVCGAWQGTSGRFTQKVVPDSLPRPSMLILDWRNARHGDLPAVHQLVVTPPRPEIG